ncbi:MAG TPA: T9SS type A sorting domain-containing protein [Bacteroidia bacterium]|nr:T9SS type A sorting domain-containing protein [Bacteroidia bacterium]
MKKIFYFLCILSFLQVRSQSWCTVGSTWYYALPQPGDGYAKFTYLYDTLVGSQMCNKIKTEYNGHGMGGFVINYSGYIYTYTQNGIVFKNNGTLNTPVYDTLYNFTGAIGTKWRCQLSGVGGGPSCSHSYIEITDAGTTVIQGQTLNWRKIYYKNYYFQGQVQQWIESGTDTLFERIGTRHQMEFITGSYCSDATDITPMPFRCFSDYQISMQFSSVACDYVTGVNNLEKTEKYFSFNNPATDILFIKFDFEPTIIQQIEIFDQLGKRVKQLSSSEKQVQMNVQDLPSGIYTLQLKLTNQLISRKLVIQK